MAKRADVVMADAQSEVFSIPILETVKAAQLQNGLRHRDFQRYRQYCTRRLARIRKSVKFTHGKGKVFVNKKVDAETATEARHLYLLLYNAERAWGYAMQLKEDDNLDKAENGDDANTRIKFHLTGRLRKASEWSQRLVAVCAAKADARTSVEAEAYAAYMAGNLAFHREEHVAALDKFATARRIYADLSQVGTPSQKELFRGCVAELEPFIRFSEHRLRLQGRLTTSILSEAAAADWSAGGDSASSSLLQSKIELVLLEARKQKVVDLATVEWKQKQVALPSQEVGLALLRPDELSAKLAAADSDKKREQLFLELLSAYDTVLKMLKSDIAKLQQQSKSGSALVHTDIEALEALEEYVRFTKLTKQVERTVAVYTQLSQAGKAPGDVAHILGMLLQSVGEILMVPGLSDFEQLAFAKYSAYQAVFKAIRAATIARAYQEERQFAEALALYQYASGFLAEGEDVLGVHPGARDAVLHEFMTHLSGELVGAQSRTTAQSFLEASLQEDAVRAQFAHLELDGDATQRTTKALLERQDDYVGGSAARGFDIVRLPPDFRAIACKPVLFDVAFGELEMPDISERMKTEEEKQAEAAAAAAAAAKTAAAGGLFGWFRK
ncbi:hypothetical protein PybrP1_009643 [[Pythium] brassicae (nom. inval.)]|nr:hypothetical protein PybrP1_009643 [[Pythium] brassicae (nom. inval.)]